MGTAATVGLNHGWCAMIAAHPASKKVRSVCEGLICWMVAMLESFVPLAPLTATDRQGTSLSHVASSSNQYKKLLHVPPISISI